MNRRKQLLLLLLLQLADQTTDSLIETKGQKKKATENEREKNLKTTHLEER